MLVASLWLMACSSMPEPAAPLTQPTQLCRQAQPVQPCLPPETVTKWLQSPELAIIGLDDPPTGIQGARVLTLSVPRFEAAGATPTTAARAIVFRAKWRALSTTSTYNVPRKELAAYAIQRLYLEPHEYVVPPTTGHCFELGHYRRMVDRAASASFPRVDCVFGYLSYWLEDVVSLDGAASTEWFEPDEGPYDPALFEREPIYRASLAHVNLLAYLIDHDDTHGGQFVMVARESHPALYMVDNSMAFETGTNPDLEFEQDWSNIHVPLPKEKVERLAALSHDDLMRLTVIEQYKLEKRRLVSVPVTEPYADKQKPMRWLGQELQVGLKQSEVVQVRLRIENLARRIERAEVETY